MFVQDEMIVGLGSGSTVYYAIKKIGELVSAGLNIKCVSTSSSTTQIAQDSGIEIIPLNNINQIDLTIDGADEVDREFNGIKGGGGALLFEKIVALYSRKNIWIVDSEKLVDQLGKYPLPVEVVPFGHKRVFEMIRDFNLNPVIRKKGDEIYYTDSGNLIFDLHLEKIENPFELNNKIKLINGVVETGLFLNIADIVIVGRGSVTETIQK